MLNSTTATSDTFSPSIMLTEDFHFYNQTIKTVFVS